MIDFKMSKYDKNISNMRTFYKNWNMGAGKMD